MMSGRPLCRSEVAAGLEPRAKYSLLFVALLLTVCSLPAFAYERQIPKQSDALEGEARARFLMQNLRGFPEGATVERSWQESENDRQFLLLIASDTWKYFDNIVDKERHLPLDQIHIAPDLMVGDYTSTTDIGLYIMCLVSGYDLGLIDRKEAVERIRATITSAEGLEKYSGFLYNYYDTTTLERTSSFVSFVDSGWYLIGIVLARQAFSDELWELCTDVLDSRDFSFFYDAEVRQMHHGYDTDENSYSQYHYGTFYTEARAGSLLAIGKGDVPQEHWFGMYRVFPVEWDWQGQIPAVFKRRYLNLEVLEGYYKYDGTKIVPSWGGSMFEGLMPLMVIDELRYAKRSLGTNARRYVDAHIDYCLNKLMYPVWGMSPCSVPGDGYGEFGVGLLGAKGYGDGVVTPHATFLALVVHPKAAIKNLRRILAIYPGIYGEYGFYDSVDVRTSDVSRRYLFLDQAMSFISINNYLNRGAIQKRFHRDPIGRNVERLLKIERFYK